jgi:hypothetical protein
MRAHLVGGLTPKYWGLELSVDFYLDACFTVRIGPLWAALELWKEKP